LPPLTLALALVLALALLGVATAQPCAANSYASGASACAPCAAATPFSLGGATSAAQCRAAAAASAGGEVILPAAVSICITPAARTAS
jgi:hypothetical protein